MRLVFFGYFVGFLPVRVRDRASLLDPDRPRADPFLCIMSVLLCCFVSQFHESSSHPRLVIIAGLGRKERSQGEKETSSSASVVVSTSFFFPRPRWPLSSPPDPPRSLRALPESYLSLAANFASSGSASPPARARLVPHVHHRASSLPPPLSLDWTSLPFILSRLLNVEVCLSESKEGRRKRSESRRLLGLFFSTSSLF